RRLQCRDNLRKIPTQGRARFPFELDRAVILESQAAKAIPSRLELPFSRLTRERFGGFRFHGRLAEPQGVQVRVLDAGTFSGVHPRILRYSRPLTSGFV